METCSGTTAKELEKIKEAANEIVELLTLGGCQKFQVLTEAEIILTHVQNAETFLKK